MDAARLAESGDAGADELGKLLRTWRDVLAERGVAALLEVVSSSTRLTERLLASDDGERRLTDVRHIGQALHAAAVVEWLQWRITEAAEGAAEERSRRLESDADAVQVVTIHGAQGLQFPIVYVPFGCDRWVGEGFDALLLHDDAGNRLRDVDGSDGPGYPPAWYRSGIVVPSVNQHSTQQGMFSSDSCPLAATSQRLHGARNGDVAAGSPRAGAHVYTKPLDSCMTTWYRPRRRQRAGTAGRGTAKRGQPSHPPWSPPHGRTCSKPCASFPTPLVTFRAARHSNQREKYIGARS